MFKKQQSLKIPNSYFEEYDKFGVRRKEGESRGEGGSGPTSIFMFCLFSIRGGLGAHLCLETHSRLRVMMMCVFTRDIIPSPTTRFEFDTRPPLLRHIMWVPLHHTLDMVNSSLLSLLNESLDNILFPLHLYLYLCFEN